MFEFSEFQKQWLLSWARESIRFYLTYGGRLPAFPVDELDEVNDPAFFVRVGAFVTLKNKRDGLLRGCIGHLETNAQLWETIRFCAVSAAVSDKRFKPMMTIEELESVWIAVSILSPMRKVLSPYELELGVHGIKLVKDGKVAVFLPEVPLEMGWTVSTMLDALFQKAGFSADAQREDAEFWLFETSKFREQEFA